ncbi:MAG: hypothetical protein EPN88_06980 [Bacteroidetes bacterium]|nr:MAG: hypothetical protein EPN88_06980 [Bacteroidota bacterium]
MKRRIFKFIIVFLIGLFPFNLYSQCDVKAMKTKVLARIKEDLVSQDSSILLMSLTAGVDIKKYRGDKYCDTLQFTFGVGDYLRFYLVGSDLLPGEASLKLLRYSTNKALLSVVLKEIKSGETPSDIRYFDYYTKNVEEYYFILQLDKKSTGCAFATSTQYHPKTTR